jgi:hypothetical protein
MSAVVKQTAASPLADSGRFLSLSKFICRLSRSTTALFRSTYLCEEAFSHMKIMKSRYQSRPTNKHLTVLPSLAPQ